MYWSRMVRKVKDCQGWSRMPNDGQVWLRMVKDVQRLTKLDHHWSIPDHPWPSLTILDHSWSSLTFHDHPWQSLTILDHINLIWLSYTSAYHPWADFDKKVTDKLTNGQGHFLSCLSQLKKSRWSSDTRNITGLVCTFLQSLFCLDTFSLSFWTAIFSQ